MSLAVVHDTAPSRHSRPPADLRSTVEELRRRHRRADPDKLAELLVTLLSEDGALLLAASRFVVEKIGAALDARARRQEATRQGPKRAARRAAEKAVVQELAAKVKEQVVLDMTVILLSGEQKKLRFTTGAELRELGSAYSRIAERVGADCLVGEVLCENEAAALLKAD